MGAGLRMGRGIAMLIMVFALIAVFAVGMLFSLTSHQDISLEEAPVKTYTKALCSEKEGMLWCEDKLVAVIDGKEILMEGSPVTGAAFIDVL